MMRNDYRRSLILLRSNASGYSGHVRLERRTLMGTMYFLVQSPGDCPTLRAALVGRGRDGVYYACALGEFQQDARGQAVLGYSFDPRDICRRELEQYQLAAITCAGDESCQVVLFGNICGHAELNWEGVRGALCELYAAQDAAQAEAEAQTAAQNGQEAEAQSVQEAEAQNGPGAQAGAGGAQADAGGQTGARAQAEIGARSGAGAAQADIREQSGEGSAQSKAGALDGRETGAVVGERSDSNAKTDANAVSGFVSMQMSDAEQSAQQVTQAAEHLTAPASGAIPRTLGDVTIHVTDMNAMASGKDAPTTTAQPSNFARGETVQSAACSDDATQDGAAGNVAHSNDAPQNGIVQNAAHFNGEAEALDEERAQAMGIPLQRTAPEQSAQPSGMQISASQYGIEQTREVQPAPGQIGAAGYGFGAIVGAQFAAGQISAAGDEADPEAGAQPNVGQIGAIQYGVGRVAGAQFAAGQVGVAGYYDAGQPAGVQPATEQSGAARTGEVLACDLLEERGVSSSSPWPGAAEALRSLFRTAPALVDAPDDQCVYVEAPMPEGCGFPFVAAGILALDGALVAIRYALPAAWTEEPPAGLEDCVWVGDPNTGWWVTEVPLEE